MGGLSVAIEAGQHLFGGLAGPGLLGGLVGDYYLALSLAERRRLIYAALAKIQRAQNLINEPIAFATVETALALAAAESRRRLDLPGGLRATAQGDALRLSAASRPGRILTNELVEVTIRLQD